MTIDNHSVVYFINEEYGVVIRANGATKEVAAWDEKRQGFAKRLDLLTASFLARTDRWEGKWCAAHPTYNPLTARKAAERMKANLPGADGMRLAKAAKQAAMRSEMREQSAERRIREIVERWYRREAQYAGM